MSDTIEQAIERLKEDSKAMPLTLHSIDRHILDLRALLARSEAQRLTIQGLEEALAEARSTDSATWDRRISEAASAVMEATGDEAPLPVFAELAKIIQTLLAERDRLRKALEPFANYYESLRVKKRLYAQLLVRHDGAVVHADIQVRDLERAALTGEPHAPSK